MVERKMHKFDRTLILLVLGLVVLIIIFIGIFYYYSYLKAYNENLALLDIKGCLNEKQNESIDPYCYALFYENVSFCEQKTVYDAKDNKNVTQSVALCKSGTLFMVALEKKDSNLCNNLADMGLREVCAVFINKDISKCKDFPGEEEYCNQLITGNIPAGNGASFNRDGYYWMKSIELKDLTYCNNITDFGDRALCMAFVSKNISYCNQPQFEECYVNNKGS